MKGDERARRQHAREVRQAKRKAEHDAAAPVQAGRQTVEGKGYEDERGQGVPIQPLVTRDQMESFDCVLDGGAKVWCDRFGNLKRVIVSASQRSSSSLERPKVWVLLSVPEILEPTPRVELGT